MVYYTRVAAAMLTDRWSSKMDRRVFGKREREKVNWVVLVGSMADREKKRKKKNELAL